MNYPDYGSSHIDPGDPGRFVNPPIIQHDHTHAERCKTGCPGHRPVHEYKATNPDPVQHSWHPGSVEEQRAHFRPQHITQAEMGPVATYGLGDELPKAMPSVVELADQYEAAVKAKKARPDREGPDYAQDRDVDESYWIRLSYPADTIPERTQWILQNVVPTALRSFIRHQLEYLNNDEALGYQGQFADIFHIVAKLKRVMWDSNYTGMATNVAVTEVQEELESLIGHALLALELLEKGNKHGQA